MSMLCKTIIDFTPMAMPASCTAGNSSEIIMAIFCSEANISRLLSIDHAISALEEVIKIKLKTA